VRHGASAVPTKALLLYGKQGDFHVTWDTALLVGSISRKKANHLANGLFFRFVL